MTHLLRGRVSRAAVVVGLAGLATGVGEACGREDPPGTERVYYDSVDEGGRLVGGVVVMPLGQDRTGRIPAPVTALMRSGVWVEGGGVGVDASAPNRVNLVTVGDGYQAAQVGSYASHVTTAVSAMFSYEPFKTYLPLFNIDRVDVVSIDSGVDNDPTQGVSRNTALDMAYWCGGTERLLCVNVAKAYQYANNAPRPPHQVLAIANSSKYGGAGYTSNELATLAGANGSAPDIAIHELGHSLGNLADEYDYGGPAAYTGGERGEPDASIYPAATMLAQQRKWWRWLGTNIGGFDGLVDTYEGAVYSVTGVYRPTNNSMMRALGRPFNLPSAESLIVEIYKIVRPIDGTSHAPGTLITGSPVVMVSTVQPVGNVLSVTWTLDGASIPGDSPALDLSLVSHPDANPHVLTARVVDTTYMVRDPALRAAWLTQTVSWTWNAPACYANCDESTEDPALSAGDFSCFLQKFRAGDAYANCDGSTGTPVLSAADFTCFLGKFRAGCL